MGNSDLIKLRLAVHAVIPRTKTNGPGMRYGIWVQGCGRHCPGCFNPRALALLHLDAPEFQPHAISGWMEIGKLVGMIADEHAASPIEGLTVSGGEPFDQPRALMELFRKVRGLGLSILAFSGYTLDELLADPETKIFFKPECIVDVLIDGPYDRTQQVEGELRGSANQTIYNLTGKYTNEDLKPPGPMECIIQPDGSISITGFTRAPFQEME